MRSFLGCCLVVAIACGGVVGGDPDGGFPCPVTQPGTMACAGEGQACTFATTICGQAGTETCTCTSGEWSCPVANCPAVTCPSSVEPGTACSTKGLTCIMAGDGCAQDEDMPCTCDGQSFQCGITKPSCSPCPPPTEIVPGGPCASSGIGASCPWEPSNCDGGILFTGACTCTAGAWSCDPGAPICDAGTD